MVNEIYPTLGTAVGWISMGRGPRPVGSGARKDTTRSKEGRTVVIHCIACPNRRRCVEKLGEW